MPDTTWELRMLYDSLCPMCRWEVAQLRKRDVSGRLQFEDITSPDFDPSRYGLTMRDVVGTMHAVLPDGTVLRGVEVFSGAYRAVGLSRLATLIEFRPLRPLVKLVYRLFATIRPRLSAFEPGMAAGDSCETGTCRVDRFA
jgi:predicted DCC family thiol-disulfide oxidoreductase YuxK